MTKAEMAADLQAFFPSWYWATWKHSCRAFLDAPTRLQKALWRVFQQLWCLPLTLRAKWLRRRYAG